MPEPTTTRRAAPPDRRSTVTIAKGLCPMGYGCRCCLNSASFEHSERSNSRCSRPHPNEDKPCRPPYPSQIRPCPERADLRQSAMPGDPPAGAACVECGMVTARRWRHPDGDLVAWCAGDLAGEPLAVDWPVPDPPTRAYNPTLQRHAWTKFAEHNRVCGYCRIWVINCTRNHYDWWQVWRWLDGRTGTNEGETRPKLPKCPGPAKEKA